MKIGVVWFLGKCNRTFRGFRNKEKEGGTAAVISPVGKVVDHGKEICFPSGMEKMGPITQKLYDTLTGIQYGKIEAPEGWIHEIM